MELHIGTLSNLINDLLFPGRCVVCDKVLPMGISGCHPSCQPLLKEITTPYCMKCGKALTRESEVYCNDCTGRNHSFDGGRAVYLYDDFMRTSMYRLKYHKRAEYADFYGKQMAEKLAYYLNDLHAQALIPIPVHPKRMEKRGYNQAELLANAMSETLDLPVKTDLLSRVSATQKQKELSARKRENNLKKAFKTSRNDVKLDTVILVDDIYTTGATMDAAAGCLKDAGVRRVYFASLCIGRNT